MAIGQPYLRPKLRAKHVWLNIWATHFTFCAQVQLATHPWRFLFLMILQNDFRIEHPISIVFRQSYIWNISSVLYWTLSCQIYDEVQITLQYPKLLLMEISLHGGITSPVVIDKV